MKLELKDGVTLVEPDSTHKILNYLDPGSKTFQILIVSRLEGLILIQLSGSKKMCFSNPDSLGFKIPEAFMALQIRIVAFIPL